MRITLAVCVVATVGCANIIDTAMDRAGAKIGQKVGDEVGDQVGTAAAGAVRGTLMDLTPALMQLYVQALFTAGFYHGGYHWDALSYKPGQWTRWQATGVDQGDELEKAFLKRTDEGHEWWRISAKGKRDGKVEEVVIEALFEAEDDDSDRGLRKLVRLRRQFPGDEEAVEVPVTDENRSAWYRRPVKLTDESVKGATVGTEKITVPAGTYKCKHLKYAHGGGGDTMQWWLSKKVPGRVVQAVFTDSHVRGSARGDDGDDDASKRTRTTVLSAKGDDARSRLGSF